MKKIPTLLFVVIAGITGTVANAVAAALIIAPAKLSLIYELPRYGIAIMVAILIPIIFKLINEQRFAIPLALCALTLIPSLLAKLYFKAGAPWHLVISLNFVYALTALFVYIVAKNGYDKFRH